MVSDSLVLPLPGIARGGLFVSIPVTSSKQEQGLLLWKLNLLYSNKKSPNIRSSHTVRVVHTHVDIIVRRAKIEDKARALDVESKATPNLRYLDVMFEHWVHDTQGDFSVAEIDGVLVGVAKLTVLPDGSAWLEALRVAPFAQGKGVGKQFYQHFFTVARERGIPSMRMYTGVRNAVSKGLAERFGFRLAATYRGASREVQPFGSGRQADSFVPILDSARSKELLLPFSRQWTGFMVMNRTFYPVTPALCEIWSEEGKIYTDEASDSLLVIGARFQADKALHIACLGGDMDKCLAFAEQKAKELCVPKISCLFPHAETGIQQALLNQGYRLDGPDYIVMEVSVQNQCLG